MNIGKNYVELCDEIRIWKFRRESIIIQIDYLLNKNKPREIDGIDYSLPKGAGSVVLDFEELLVNISPMQSEVIRLDKLIDNLEKCKAGIEKKLEDNSGIEYDIIYKKYVEGKSLKIIAEEVGYSYDWIRHKVNKLKL
jgi:hypothetical protein